MAVADGEVAKRRRTSHNAQNKPKRLIRCGSCDRPLVIAQFTDDKFGVVCAHYKDELVSQDYMHPCIYLGRAEADGVVATRPRTSQKALNKPERWMRCMSCTRHLSIAQFTNEKFGVICAYSDCACEGKLVPEDLSRVWLPRSQPSTPPGAGGIGRQAGVPDTP